MLECEIRLLRFGIKNLLGENVLLNEESFKVTQLFVQKWQGCQIANIKIGVGDKCIIWFNGIVVSTPI